MKTVANMDQAQLRSLLRLCREEGVLQLQTHDISFTLGPKPAPEPVVTNKDGSERKETDEERLERELFDQGQGG